MELFIYQIVCDISIALWILGSNYNETIAVFWKQIKHCICCACTLLLLMAWTIICIRVWMLWRGKHENGNPLYDEQMVDENLDDDHVTISSSGMTRMLEPCIWCWWMHPRRRASPAPAAFPQPKHSNYSFSFVYNRFCRRKWLEWSRANWNRSAKQLYSIHLASEFTFKSFVSIEHWQQLPIEWN